MTQEELNGILERHQHWLKEDCDGWKDMRADLSGVDLSWANLREVNLRMADLSEADLREVSICGADLSGANLREVNLCGANLRGATLRGVNFHGADLRGATLRGVNLHGADLRDADLSGADLHDAGLCDAYLSGADLHDADLSVADLRGADLYGAILRSANFRGANFCRTKLSDAERFRLGKVLDEPLVGFKKTSEDVVITAEIPTGAVVFCINGHKCRTNRAKIIDMGGHDVLHSTYDDSFEYRLGQEIEIKDFNLMYNVECASGFHFFRTRKEAEDYNG